MSSSIETNDVAKAKSLISRAISVGAPAYNAGDIAGCARVYEGTAEKIVPLLPKELRTNLEQAQACASGDSNEAKAWALRRQFDAIFEYQPPAIPSPATNICDIKLEAFTPQQLLVPPLEVMDGVMGGISQGRWTESTKTFSGHTSLANNGGFASLRWRFPVAQNWSYAKGLYLKVQHSQPTSHTFRLILKDSTCERIRLANFKAISGTHPTSGGTITLTGTPFKKPRAHALAQMGVAYVPQGRDIFPLLTVRENLETGFACLPRSEHFVPDEIFGLFPILKDFLHRRGGDLPNGPLEGLC